MFYTCGPNEAMVVSGKNDVIYPKHFHNKIIISHFFFFFVTVAVDLKAGILNKLSTLHMLSYHHTVISHMQFTIVLVSSLSGFCRSPPLMIAGGRVFVVPCIQKIQRSVNAKAFCLLELILVYDCAIYASFTLILFLQDICIKMY